MYVMKCRSVSKLVSDCVDSLIVNSSRNFSCLSYKANRSAQVIQNNLNLDNGRTKPFTNILAMPMNIQKYFGSVYNLSNISHQYLAVHVNSVCSQIQNRRNKSTKKTKKRPEHDSDSDSEEEDEDLSNEANIIKIKLQSLRLDGFLKKALNIARNKAESAFYEGNVRVNGKKPNKKSFQLRIGDEVDLIRGICPVNPDLLSVSRLEVVSVMEAESEEDRLLIKVRRIKTMFIENYDFDPWKKGSSSE